MFFVGAGAYFCNCARRGYGHHSNQLHVHYLKDLALRALATTVVEVSATKLNKRLKDDFGGALLTTPTKYSKSKSQAFEIAITPENPLQAMTLNSTKAARKPVVCDEDFLATLHRH